MLVDTAGSSNLLLQMGEAGLVFPQINVEIIFYVEFVRKIKLFKKLSSEDAYFFKELLHAVLQKTLEK